MATQESWQTRDSVILLLRRLQDIVNYYRATFAALDAIKVTVFDNPTKKADLKSILDLDASFPVTLAISEYVKAKTNNDALIDIIIS